MAGKISGLAAGALLASVSLAYADTITQSQTYTNDTNWGTPTLVDLNFAGFDSSLGTLTGVTVTGTESINGTIQAQNTSDATSDISTYLNNVWDAYLPGSGLNGITDLVTDGLGSFSNTATDSGLAPGAWGQSWTLTGSSQYQAVSQQGDDLSRYESAFSVSADDWGFIGSTDDNGDNVYATYTDTGTLEVDVTYTYTAAPPPVPEPATLALLGSGLLGLGVARRRRA